MLCDDKKVVLEKTFMSIYNILDCTGKKCLREKLCSMTIKKVKESKYYYPFHATGLFVYPLKTSENLCFCDVFKAYRKRAVS